MIKSNAFLVISFAINALFAQQSPSAHFKNEKEITTWMTYYYLNPQPQYIYESMTSLARSGMLLKNIKSCSGFLAGVLDSNPLTADKIFLELSQVPIIDHRFLASTIIVCNLANKPTMSKCLFSLESSDRSRLDKIMANKPSALNLVEITKPADLDALWMYFMATGSEESVLRIVATVKWHKSNAVVSSQYLIGAAAQWSLESNAVQHPRVLKILKQQLGKPFNELTPALHKIIDAAELEIKKRHTPY